MKTFTRLIKLLVLAFVLGDVMPDLGVLTARGLCAAIPPTWTLATNNVSQIIASFSFVTDSVEILIEATTSTYYALAIIMWATGTHVQCDASLLLFGFVRSSTIATSLLSKKKVKKETIAAGYSIDLVEQQETVVLSFMGAASIAAASEEAKWSKSFPIQRIERCL